MKDLIRLLIPHAPAMGLYLSPDIPEAKLKGAIADYAGGADPDHVEALYDATLMGSGKDGAVFLPDRFIFQNNNLEEPQTIRYNDLVRVTSKKRLFSGKKVLLDVNQGRATVSVELDFSGKPKAAEYVARLLHEAMMRDVNLGSSARDSRAEPSAAEQSSPARTPRTDRVAVEEALDVLCGQGELTEADRIRMLRALDRAD